MLINDEFFRSSNLSQIKELGNLFHDDTIRKDGEENI